MPDGAVIIAAITSCTNTSNPRNVIAAGLLARNANRDGPQTQAVGQDPRWPRDRRRWRCT
jgi:aconitase A